jgi:hypothetical protein
LVWLLKPVGFCPVHSAVPLMWPPDCLPWPAI